MTAGLGTALAPLRRKSGNAAIEFALIAPILAAMLVAMTDLGVAIYEKMQIRAAADAGVQYAVAKGWNSTAIQNAVTSATSMPAARRPAPTSRSTRRCNTRPSLPIPASPTR
jgi:Flp pilus assembly protein TadG